MSSSTIGPKSIGLEAADQLVSLTASASLTAAAHAGRLLTLDAAAGLTATLPAATGTGDVYRFVVGTTVTSNAAIVKVAVAADTMAGFVCTADDTGTPVPGIWVAATGTSDTISLNGGTTGGIIGDELILTDYASGKWLVRGFLKQSGSEATPFSATVS